MEPTARFQPYPAIVNLTTASLEPALVSSDWNSESFPITFTLTIFQEWTFSYLKYQNVSHKMSPDIL